MAYYLYSSPTNLLPIGWLRVEGLMFSWSQDIINRLYCIRASFEHKINIFEEMCQQNKNPTSWLRTRSAKNPNSALAKHVYTFRFSTRNPFIGMTIPLISIN